MIKKSGSAHIPQTEFAPPPRGLAFPLPGRTPEGAKKAGDTLLLLDLQINTRIPSVFTLETIL